MWARLTTLAWRLRARLANEYTRGAVFRKQGARVGQGCRLLICTLGSEPYLVEIGSETLVSGNVLFVTHDGATWVIRDLRSGVNRFKPVRIGERCFIGAGSILLPGTDIGDRTIIGAGSVVTGKIPAGVVAAGVPARVISTTQEFAAKAAAESLSFRLPVRNAKDKRRQLVGLLMTSHDADD